VSQRKFTKRLAERNVICSESVSSCESSENETLINDEEKLETEETWLKDIIT